MEQGLKICTGAWVCFLVADDYFWNEHVLSNLQPHLSSAEQSGIRIVYGNVARVDKHGNIIQMWGRPWRKIRWQMRHGMPLGMPHTGLMHHKELFKIHGFFDDRLKLSGDYEFLLRELKHKDRHAFFVEELVTVAQQVGGTADSNAYRFHQEVAAARRQNGLNRFSWLWWLVHIRCIIREKSSLSPY